MIKLTDMSRRNFYLRDDLIISLTGDSDNPLVTIVQTTLMSQKGPVAYQVLDSAESISSQISGGVMNGAAGSALLQGR